MPNPITTIEFRFDREHCSKDGMFFQGPSHLLALPAEGTLVDLDRPTGWRGRVIRKEIRASSRFNEVIVHCELEAGGQDGLTGVLTGHPFARFVKDLFKRS